MTSCMRPRRQPSKKAMGRSMGRAPKAKGPTQAEATPYIKTRNQTGYWLRRLMISSRRDMASSTPMVSWMTSL